MASNTLKGAMTGNPWLAGAGAVADVAGAIWGGGGSPDATASTQGGGNLHLVNPGQQALWNQMATGLANGGGDFGFGSNYKQGKSQIQDFMASSGVKLTPNSGAYAGAMGNMTGQALSQDAQNRRNYTMQLLGTPLQIASGVANMIPGSPSQGFDLPTTYSNFKNSKRGGFQSPANYGDGYNFG